jgi:hypothetical protein
VHTSSAIPNDYINKLIYSLAQVSTTSAHNDGIDSRTELDSHANMVVLGSNCFVFDNVHGRTCDVEPFDKSLGVAKKIPIVDAALVYDCSYSHETYLLIICNALQIPSMPDNLLRPFILREAGLQVKDTPKIHVDDPDNQDHAIVFPNDNLCIPLQLWGIFSFFHIRIPTNEEIMYKEPLFLTPDSDSWDPYLEHFAKNEDSMLDWEGNIQPKRKRKSHILDWNVTVDGHDYENAVDFSTISAFQVDNPATIPTSILNNEFMDFAADLSAHVETSKHSTGIGRSGGYQDGEDDLFEPIYSLMNNFEAAISSVEASKKTTVSTETLSKIWNIKPELAKKALNQTTQLYRRGADTELSRRYSTNDQMLRYKRINSQFFTDTFFVTEKGKSTCGNTCAQLFVSDKGVYCHLPHVK